MVRPKKGNKTLHQHEHREHNIDLPGGGLEQQLPHGGEHGELLVKEPLSGTRQKNVHPEQTSQ